MSILVTGGAGYIGSHVCKALAHEGYTPITYDNLSCGHRMAVKWGPFIKGDIRDKKLLKKTLKKYRPIGIIHLAALTNARKSDEDPITYYQNNVEGTLTLLDIAQENNVSYFVFSSSCAVYGIPQKIPLDEYHPKAPINNYGRSKEISEQMLQTIGHACGMKTATLRYFNAAGADIEGEIGEKHAKETHLIPLVLQARLKKNEPFIIFGDKHPTADGTPIRDFVHVSDLAKAHVQSLNWMMDNQDNLILNLGSGSGYSVKEIIKAVETICGFPISTKTSKSFPGDPPTLIANSEKAYKLLGWKPIHSNLSTIIETAFKWHQK